jgi:uncharacterized protein (DUF2252 family)
MLEQIMEGYEEPLVDADPDLRSRRPECVQVVMRQAVKRTWDHLAKERLEDTHPTIPLGRRFWPVADEEKRQIERFFFRPRKCAYWWRHYAPRRDDARVEVVDAAYWMKGCSSLGRLRFAVLLEVGKNQAKEGGLCRSTSRKLLQAAAPRHPQHQPKTICLDPIR